MSNSLDANIFNFGELTYYQILENILDSIYLCYQKIQTELIMLENHENEIRDEFYWLLRENKEQFRLSCFHIDTETREHSRQSEKEGKLDLRFLPINRYLGQDAYYTIECKRIDETLELNEKYIKEGMYRFISEKYSSAFNTNAMLSFVVKAMNIDDNINKINELITNNLAIADNDHQLLKKALFIENYDYTYKSIHKADQSQKEFTIYHLWLDVSKNIGSTKNK